MRFVKFVILLILGLVAGLFAILYLLAAGDNLNIKSVRALAVMSGSMAPQIPVGSVVIVKPAITYFPGDIVTFLPDSSSKMPVTHRITKFYETGVYNKWLYETKGDANNAEDIASVNPEQIIGKVALTIPYAGYIVNFFKQPYGFILFVIVPITIIVYEEFKSLKKELVGLLKKIRSFKLAGRDGTAKGKSGVKKIATTLPIIAAALTLISVSVSYFSDKENSPANSFVAGVWTTPTPTPPPISPTPTPSYTKLVINEVYYDVCTPASQCGNDPHNEWIEIYNPNDTAVDISGWIIEENQGTSHQRTIPTSDLIPAYGYAVITPKAATWGYWPGIPLTTIKVVLDIFIGNGLHNSNDRVILKNPVGAEIDAMSYGTDTYAFSPACLDVASGHSLERDPDGTDTDTASDFVDRISPSPGS